MYRVCVRTRACVNACMSQPVAKIDVTGRPTDDLGPVPTADISTASSGSTHEQESSIKLRVRTDSRKNVMPACARYAAEIRRISVT